MKTASVVFLVLLALPFFVALKDSSLWDANEAFYAQTPREMLDRGEWLVPYFNGTLRVNKPPLSYWMVAPLYKMFGVSVFWERFPMALLAYGSVIVVFVIGRTLFEESVALWGAGIFATTTRFLLLSRRLFIDILLLFCLLMTVACFLSWLKNGKKGNFLLSCFFLGLAFLAKGPVAFLPVVFLGIYLVVSGNLSTLRRAPWVWGSFILLLTSTSWFLMLDWEMGWKIARDFLFKENLSRFSHVSFGPRRGPHYYLGVFLADFFPWSLFFIAAAIEWVRKQRHLASTERRRAVHLLLIWFAVIFIVFSLSYNKLEYYILPLYPAASLFLADYLCNARPHRALLWSIGILFLLAGSGVFAFAKLMYPGTRGLWIPLLVLPVILVSLLRKKWEVLIPSLAVFYFALLALYLKPFEQYKPVHFFAQTIQAQVSSQGIEKNYLAGYYRFSAPSLAFYLNRPILDRPEQEEAVRYLRLQTPVYLIVDAADFAALERAAAIPLQIVEVRPKLYTHLRTLIEGLKRGEIGNIRNAWTRPIYLITNQRAG